MHGKQRIIVAVWLLVIASTLAQENKLKFSHLTVDEGLPQNTINCIVQDEYGFIWIGTDGGLAKYDGYSFTNFFPESGNPGSISGIVVKAIVKGRGGTLWVGTQDGGLDKLTLSTNTFEKAHISTDTGQIELSALAAGNDSSLWIGCANGSVYRFTLHTNKVEHFGFNQLLLHKRNKSVKVIYQDSNGLVWIGFLYCGLASINAESGEVINYNLNDIPANYSTHSWIRTVVETVPGEIWVGTDSGLLRFDSNQKTFREFNYRPDSKKSINSGKSLLYTSWGKLLVCGDGLSIFDTETETWKKQPKNKTAGSGLDWSDILSSYESTDGTIWLGTVLKGINVYSPNKYKFKHIKYSPFNDNSLLSNNVRMVFKSSGGTYWVAGDGLNRIVKKLDGGLQFYNFSETLPGLNPTSIVEDSIGNVWVNGFNYLVKFNPDNFQSVKYTTRQISGNNSEPGIIHMIFKGYHNSIWVHADSGLYSLNVAKAQMEKTSSKKEKGIFTYRIDAAHQDKEGLFWFGTWGEGLIKYNHLTGEVVNYKKGSNKKGPSHNIIHSIWGTEKGILWLGTRGGGLNKFDKKTETFSYINTSNGLLDKVIYGVLGDKRGNLWLSSNSGITKYNIESGTARVYDLNDGLQSNEFNHKVCYRGVDGEMMFGGINGLNIFYPEEIKDNLIPPQVQITNVSVIGKNLAGNYGNYNSRFELEHDENYISFEFVALHYANASRNRYAFMMEGIDEGWVYCGTRRFNSYNGLPPGSYIFRVKASNSDGVWNESGVSLSFIIHPPFWRTLWAYSIYSLILFAGFYGVHKYQSGKIKMAAKRETEEKIKFERAKADEREKIYTEAAADFHDQVSGEIGTINIYSELVKRSFADSEKEALDNYLSKINLAARNLVNFKNSFLWVLDTTDISLQELAHFLKDRGEELFGFSEINFSMSRVPASFEGLILPSHFKRNILFIFIECMNNVVKHSQCSSVEISIREINEAVEISICDNGTGIRKTDAEGRGLANIKSRVAKFNGMLKIETEEGSGTKISVHFEIP